MADLFVYFVPGIAGAVVVAVEVIVEVTADCGAAFGASCFWHPAIMNAATARAAMIAVIFFISIHPLSSHLNDCGAFVAIKINWINNALQFEMLLDILVRDVDQSGLLEPQKRSKTTGLYSFFLKNQANLCNTGK